MTFGLLATSPRWLEEQTAQELDVVLSALGDNPKIEKADPPGIILIKSSIPFSHVINELRKILADEPWRIRHLQRVVPLEIVSESFNNIVNLIQPYLERIKEKDTFRVTVEKRFSRISSRDIINKIAGLIQNRVNLENPDWVIQIEIIGKIIGASVIRPNDILSVLREKRGF